MDEFEKAKRIRFIKTILIDIFFGVSVIILFIILILAVKGWRLNSNFHIEQNGLLSIHAFPRDARISVDNKSETTVANFSKMLSSGEHQIIIKKDGYDTWSKKVKISSGWLTKLSHPKLFKKERESSAVKTFENAHAFFLSPDREYAFFYESEPTRWTLINNFNSTPTVSSIDLGSIFSTKNTYSNFSISAWNKSNTKFILQFNLNNHPRFALIDLKNPSKSFILPDQPYKKIAFQTDDGKKLLVLIDTTLYKLENDILEKVEEDIENFVQHESFILILTTAKAVKDDSDNAKNHPIKYLIATRDDFDIKTTVAELSVDQSPIFDIRVYHDFKYLVYTIENVLYLYRFTDLQSDSSNSLELILKTNLNFSPKNILFSNNNSFFILSSDNHHASVEFEVEEPVEYKITSPTGFIDDYLLYSYSSDSKNLLISDFDGSNQRTILSNKDLLPTSIFISKNNKYLYYLEKSSSSITLVQEQL